MEGKKNPHPDWRMWIITATMVIQLLNSIQYYQAWNQLQNSTELQSQVLQYQVESLKAIKSGTGWLEVASFIWLG